MLKIALALVLVLGTASLAGAAPRKAQAAPEWGYSQQKPLSDSIQDYTGQGF